MNSRLLCALVLLSLTFCLQTIAPAEGPPAPPLPEMSAHPAIDFAKGDAARQQKLVQKLTTDASKATAAVTAVNQEIAAATKSKSESQKSIQTATASIKKSQQAIKTTQAKIAQKKKELQAAKKQLEQASAKVKQSSATAKKAEELLKETEKKLTDSENKTDDLKQAVEKAKSELKKTQNTANKSQEGLKTAETKLAALTKELQLAETKLKSTTTALATSEIQKKKSEAALKLADSSLKQLPKKAKPLTDTKKLADTKLLQASTKLTRIQEKLTLFAATRPAATPQNIRLTQTFKHNRPMISCRFDDSGDYIFSGAMDNSLHRWDLIDSTKTTLDGHKSWIRRFDFSPDGKSLITGAYEGQLIWWQTLANSPSPQKTIKAHHGYVRAVAISPDGSLLATGGNDNLVKIWSTTDGSLVKELAGHERHVYNVAFHPNGQHIVSGDLMGVLKIWEVGSWNNVRDLNAGVLTKYDTTFRADCGGFRGMDFGQEGKLLAVAGISAVSNAFAGIGVPTVVLFDWATGKQLQVMTPPGNTRGTCWSVRFHPTGRFLAGAGSASPGGIWFWKIDEAKPFFSFKTTSAAYDVDFHPDGLRLAVSLYDKTVRVYDIGPKLPSEKKKPVAKKK